MLVPDYLEEELNHVKMILQFTLQEGCLGLVLLQSPSLVLDISSLVSIFVK